jgi:hypothetical protein
MEALWRKALEWSRESATHLVANVVMAGSAVLETAASFADELATFAGDAFGDPELKTQVLALLPSRAAPVVVILIMLAVKRARNRTLEPRA